jgi:hypothetical protein
MLRENQAPHKLSEPLETSFLRQYRLYLYLGGASLQAFRQKQV